MLRHLHPSSVSAATLPWLVLLALLLTACSADRQGRASSDGAPLPGDDAGTEGDATAPEDADASAPNADVPQHDDTPPDGADDADDDATVGPPDAEPPPPLQPGIGTPATLTPSAADARSPRFQLRSTLRPVAAGGAASPRFQLRHTTLVPQPD